MLTTNKQWTLAKRPVGEPQLSDFKLIEKPVPDLKDGEILLKTKYFSLDPYMRGRMNETTFSYVENFNLGEILKGGAVCTVESSKNQNFKVGDTVLSFTGWQEYAISNGDVVKLPDNIKASYFLGALGMTGLTAYYGLLEIGQPKAGETLAVAAATGAVGSIVGQLAKARGCHVVGIAGGPEKCRYAVEELGFEACVDHKSTTFREDLKLACPNGIDIYFENVGGHIFMEILPLLNVNARIPLCGLIAHYNAAGPEQGPDLSSQIFRWLLVKRIKLQGFIITDHNELTNTFLKEMIPLVVSGKVKVKEDIIKGIEKAPEAFIGLLKGKNFGKLLIEV